MTRSLVGLGLHHGELNAVGIGMLTNPMVSTPRSRTQHSPNAAKLASSFTTPPPFNLLLPACSSGHIRVLLDKAGAIVDLLSGTAALYPICDFHHIPCRVKSG
jgi:hypothetical protein